MWEWGEIIKTVVGVVLVLFLSFGQCHIQLRDTETEEIRHNWRFQGLFTGHDSSEDND